MKKFFQWIRELLSDNNSVNENIVLGFLYAIAAIVGGFVNINSATFYAFIGASLTCFGLKFIKH